MDVSPIGTSTTNAESTQLNLRDDAQISLFLHDLAPSGLHLYTITFFTPVVASTTSIPSLISATMVKSGPKPKHNPSKSTPPHGAAPSAKKTPAALALKTKKLGLLKGQTKLSNAAPSAAKAPSKSPPSPSAYVVKPEFSYANAAKSPGCNSSKSPPTTASQV
jgi:hypothetical protein